MDTLVHANRCDVCGPPRRQARRAGPFHHSLIGMHGGNALRAAMLRGLFLLLLLAVAVPVGRSRDTADDAARREWMAGYVKLEEASRAEKDRNYPLALQLYRKAHAAFLAVRSRYPDWNPALIDYRINYCAARIKRLEGLVAANRNQMTRTELLELCDQYAGKIQKLQQENLRLSRRLDITSQALDRARTEAARSAKAAAMVPDLLKQHDLLEKRLAEATERVTAMQRELADLERLRKAAARAEAAARERDQAQARLKETTEQLEATAAAYERLRKAYSTLRQQMDDAEKRANEWKQELDKARAECETVRQELSKARTDLARQTKSAADLQKKYAVATVRTEQQTEEIRRLNARLDELAGWRERWEKTDRTRRNLETMLRDLQARIDGFEKENADLEKEKDAWQKRAATAETALAAANKRIADFERERAQADSAQTAAAAGKAKQIPPPEDTENLRLVLDSTLDALADAWNESIDAELARDAALAEITERDGRIRALQKERDALSRSLEDLRTRLKKTEERLAEYHDLTEQNQTLQARLREETDRRGKAETAVRALQTVIEDQRKRLNDYRNQIATLNETVDQQQKQIARLQRQLTPDGDVIGSWRRKELELRKALAQARDALAAEQKRSKDLERTLAAQKELGRTQEEALRRLTNEKKNLETALAAVKHDLAAARERIRILEDGSAVVEGLKASLEKTDAALEDSRRKLSEASQETARLRTALDAERARANTAEEEVRRLRNALASMRAGSAGEQALRRQIRSLSEQLGKARDRIAALEKSISDGAPARVPAKSAGAVGGGDSSSPQLSREQQRRLRDRRMLVRGFLRQGVQAEQAGRKEAAVWNYKKVLEYDPDNATALVRLGLLSAEGGDDEAAVGYLSKAFYKNPDDTDILIPLGYALVRRREVDMAVSMLARAAALKPDDPIVHRALGVAYSALGWSEAAETELRRALKLAPNDAQSAFNLAVLLATRGRGRLAEAKKWYALARKNGAEPDPGLDALFRE